MTQAYSDKKELRLLSIGIKLSTFVLYVDRVFGHWAMGDSWQAWLLRDAYVQL